MSWFCWVYKLGMSLCKNYLPNDLPLSHEDYNVDMLFRTFKKDLILV